MVFVKNKLRSCNAIKIIPSAIPADNKTPVSLKPEPNIVKKSMNQNSAQMKEAKFSLQVQARNEDQKKTTGGKQETDTSESNGGRDINLSHGNKEKKIASEMLEEKSKLDQKAEQNHGLIFMCNSKTKPDCFLYYGTPSTWNQQAIQVAGAVPQPTQNPTTQWQPQNVAQAPPRPAYNNADQKAEESLGGLIFMCNSKTKPDCFRYYVMGVPTSKQKLVMGIRPGLKLFLYDFDLKLLHGIYMASSAGGIKLEPAAFGGGFPVQVRFMVLKDCLPLPEDIFRNAIKENYNEKTHKFKTELTIQQVMKLTELFQPAPLLHSNAQPSVQDAQPAPIICPQPAATKFGEETRRGQHVYRDHYTGDEAAGTIMPSNYERSQLPRRPISPRDMAQSYGLQWQRNILSATAPISSILDTCKSDQGKEQLQRNPTSRSGDAMRKEAACLDPLFLSEMDHRAYGLRPELPNAATSTIETAPTALENYPKNPYYTYSYGSRSLVDQYLPVPRTVAAPSESYSMRNDITYMENETRNHRGRVVSDEAGRMYSAHASHALSGQNQKYRQLGGQPEVTSTSVSSRYSFAGPSLLRR